MEKAGCQDLHNPGWMDTSMPKQKSLAALPHKVKGSFPCLSTAENRLNFAAPTAKEICATKT
jgi:hypothetical protein